MRKRSFANTYENTFGKVKRKKLERRWKIGEWPFPLSRLEAFSPLCTSALKPPCRDSICALHPTPSATDCPICHIQTQNLLIHMLLLKLYLFNWVPGLFAVLSKQSYLQSWLSGLKYPSLFSTAELCSMLIEEVLTKISNPIHTHPLIDFEHLSLYI